MNWNNEIVHLSLKFLIYTVLASVEFNNRTGVNRQLAIIHNTPSRVQHGQ